MLIKVNGIAFKWSMKRFLINISVIALIATAFVLYSTNLVKANSRMKSVTVIVQKGDTLWSIAESAAPQSDPRVVIENIKQINHLSESNLKAGQKLSVNFN